MKKMKKMKQLIFSELKFEPIIFWNRHGLGKHIIFLQKNFTPLE